MNAAQPDQIFEDEARLQLNDNGSLRHLLTLKGLDRSLLVDILDDAERYLTPAGSLPARSDALVISTSTRRRGRKAKASSTRSTRSRPCAATSWWCVMRVRAYPRISRAT
jgi:hypothetical protein